MQLTAAGIAQREHIALTADAGGEKVQKSHGQKPQAGDHRHPDNRISEIRPAGKQHCQHRTCHRNGQGGEKRVQNEAKDGAAVGFHLPGGCGKFRQQKMQMPLQPLPRIRRDHGGDIVFFFSVPNGIDKNRMQPQQLCNQTLADVNIIDFVQADGVASIGNDAAVNVQFVLSAPHHKILMPD